PSLPQVAHDISRLLTSLTYSPDIIIGHSAGAAIAVELIGKQKLRPDCVISLNGAFRPFGGFASMVFPVMARLMHLNPFTAPVLAMSARRKDRIRRLIEQTGSSLRAEQLDTYARLLSAPGHISGVLAMMANWDLAGIEKQLASLPCPMLFVAGTGDRAVDPSEAGVFSGIVPEGELLKLQGRGHLLHEEEPEVVASIIKKYAHQWGEIQDNRSDI
ncbi:MAG: alpha/beta fold hydrolase BchO, partial [Pseudomonadota bacterium]